MKTLITILFSTVCLTAMAQKSSKESLSESVHDDGKTMSVKISGDVNGRSVNYSNKFNVKGMSTAEKDALTKRITDSLGIKSSHQPTPTTPPTPPATNRTVYAFSAPDAPDAPKTRGTKIYEHRDIKSSINDDGESMYIKFKGTLNDKPVKFERILDVKGKSAKEKNDMIKSITDSLGISEKVKIYLGN
ncbi:hypothetical protein [Mucilaginibacter terrae]|uniref:Uncharacterized protein n=1 Tax=Mucilaginibacter terrae TaxID=1955052 RepID=A0ABU3GQA3_9SPHI|nr:hypothetical protein [Mucilaginibacter terrae]MDT3401661.1 hypothetical protein [Mucilaginibacter terrae]